jgi:hypothetical protein
VVVGLYLVKGITYMYIYTPVYVVYKVTGVYTKSQSAYKTQPMLRYVKWVEHTDGRYQIGDTLLLTPPADAKQSDLPGAMEQFAQWQGRKDCILYKPMTSPVPLAAQAFLMVCAQQAAQNEVWYHIRGPFAQQQQCILPEADEKETRICEIISVQVERPGEVDVFLQPAESMSVAAMWKLTSHSWQTQGEDILKEGLLFERWWVLSTLEQRRDLVTRKVKQRLENKVVSTLGSTNEQIVEMLAGQRWTPELKAHLQQHYPTKTFILCAYPYQILEPAEYKNQVDIFEEFGYVCDIRFHGYDPSQH